MKVIQAAEAANQSKNFINKIKKNKEESERKYRIFLEQSERVFDTINKQINYSLSRGWTSASFLVLPTCFTIEIFEKILKYHLEKKCGYKTITEIIHPQAHSIKTDINTSAIAVKISWETEESEDNLKQIAQNAIDNYNNKNNSVGDLSDGYHTFDELYYHRCVLFSLICNQNNHIAWKSKKHYTGDMYDDMFIVGINTQYGQVTYHYNLKYWDMFNVPELENAPEWDGSSPSDCIERMRIWSNNIK